jgi:hypothetical protein
MEGFDHDAYSKRAENGKLRDAYGGNVMVCTIPTSTWIDWQGWKAGRLREGDLCATSKHRAVELPN